MTDRLKSFCASALAAVVFLAAPGLPSYAAAAQVTSRGASAGPSAPAVPVSLGSGLGVSSGLGTLALAPSLNAAALSALPKLQQPVLAAPAAAVLPSAAPQASAPQAATVLGSVQAAQVKVAEGIVPQNGQETSRGASAIPFEGRGFAGTVEAAPVEAPVDAASRPAALSKPQRSAPAVQEAPALAGKSLLYVVSKVGGRDYLYDNIRALSEKHGFRVLVLGYPDQKDHAISKGIKPEDYYSADIGNHSAENIAAIKAQVQGIAKTRRIDAVKTYLNAYAQLEAELAGALGVPGFAPEAVAAAHTKSLARKLMNAYPDASLHLPAFEARSEAEAREAFAKIKAAGFDRAVAKPDSGGGGWGVTLDLTSPEAAAAAYRDITAQIEDLVARDPRKARSKQIDQKPLVLFEAQIPDGLMLDAEMVVRDGVPVFASLAYNPPALGNQERGTTYPAALSSEMAALAKAQAAKALEAVGLKTGNAHVELILTLINGKLAAPIVEINARMGGADIWASVRESVGVDVMEEGLLAAFGQPSRAAPRAEPVLLQHRFIIAQTAGTIKAVRGLPQAGGDVFLSELFLKPGDKVPAHELLGNITVRGADEAASRERLFELLKGVSVDIETPEGKLVTQDGLYGHDTETGRLTAADWADRIDFGRAGWLGRIKMLPRSFLWGFSPAWTLNAMAQEIQAVALPLFTASLFGLPAALMVTGLGYVTRVAGAWLGSFFMARFNPKWVNVAAVAALALAGLPIPIAAALGASSGVMLGMFLGNAVVQGLVYGINRGVAENLLPRMIIGNHNPAKLELGLNYAYQWVEIACIAMALFVAVPMLSLVGGSAMMVISSAGIGLSALVYATLKYREAWRKPEAKAAAAPKSSEPSPLGLRDYLPYAFFRFMHFMVYGVLATVFALSVFSSPGAAGTMIGLYDGGSWLASLLATLALLPEKKLGRKGWTVAGAVASAAFLWSAMLSVPVLTFALGGVLGALITVNSNKWMAYYSQSLSQDKYRDLSKWMMTASVLAMLPIFGAVSAARVFPAVGAVLTMPVILLAVNVAVTVVALAMLALMRGKPKA